MNFDQWYESKYSKTASEFSATDLRSAFEIGAETAIEAVSEAVKLLERGNAEPLYSILSGVD